MVSTKSLLLAAFTTITATYAAPTKGPCKSLTPTLPSTGGDDLVAPSPTARLKKIAIGHGIQNYTCSGPDATPSATGALAVLYDVTTLYPGLSKTASLSIEAFNSLPHALLWDRPVPLNRPSNSSYSANTSSPFPSSHEDLKGLANCPALKYAGHHYFDSTGTPTFDLDAIGMKASVLKTGSVSAPKDADRGVLDTGAVAWLRLTDSGKGMSKGVNLVYRVITAGGNAEGCGAAGVGTTQSVPYTTFYWFYEE
ncbi:hypothetical protein QBC32DRAFT_110466 [Pseudoneurospora amorphoporcata]|uniref:Malate dehydrogenase n=1 Tax=Pseudoneurospora amorphoporcata TaxID=241081 RepID=A0AAN6NXG8_9PEZI|nr:hypothetical protein QBC32DRAFT_110466 [Pseudoneurospora amorphoporcata]